MTNSAVKHYQDAEGNYLGAFEGYRPDGDVTEIAAPPADGGMKYYRDTDGNYLGAFQGVIPSGDVIEIAAPPGHAKQRWVNGAWQVYTPPPTDEDVKALIVTLPQKTRLKFWSLIAQGRVALEYGQIEDVRAMIQGIVPADAIEAQALGSIKALFGIT